MTNLEGSKLLVQQGHVVVVFCLVEVAGDWSSQTIFLDELLDMETSTVVSRAVRQSWLVKGQFSRLLVDQEDVAMETSVWRIAL